MAYWQYAGNGRKCEQAKQHESGDAHLSFHGNGALLIENMSAG
jgi:hypothetical protein